MVEGEIEFPKIHELVSRGVLRGIPRRKIDLLGHKFEYPDPEEIVQPDPRLYKALSLGVQMLNTAKRFEDQGSKPGAIESLDRAEKYFRAAEAIAAGKPRSGDQAEDVDQASGSIIDKKV